AVMMLDLDGLKRINDTHGHPVGAHTISEVGKVIGAQVGTLGAACRFGGGEFAIFLPAHSKAQAKKIGETVRERIWSAEFEKDGVVVNPTISIGVAAFPEDATTPEQLVAKADEALYRAKRAGRDRVVV